MKSLFIIGFSVLVLTSCGSGSESPAVVKDTVAAATSNAIDSAANNSAVPPSAAPGNAGNSSLADTAYKAKDSAKKK